MASVNKVIIIGNPGKDPELRYMPNGTAACSLSVATSRHWKSKDSGERQEETEWHRIVFFDRLAEIVGEYVKKGKPIYVEGRLKTKKWTDKEGIERYTTEIIAESLQLLGGREQGDAAPAPAQRQAQGRAPATAPRAPAAKSGTGFDDMEDDIPF